MILPLINGNDSPEMLTFEEGTIVDYHEGGDTYIKATVSEVYQDDAKGSYYSITFDNVMTRQTEADHLTRVEPDASSSVESTSNNKNG